MDPSVAPAGACSKAETAAEWYRSGAERAAANGAVRGRAGNVILFIGYGMGLTTVAAARILEGQRRSDSGEENQQAWESFPFTALSKTYNTDSQTPDSAGTMTAISTGVKSHRGAIALAAGRTDDCTGSLQRPLPTWLQLADSAGMATGIVTTARLTDATPGRNLCTFAKPQLGERRRPAGASRRTGLSRHCPAAAFRCAFRSRAQRGSGRPPPRVHHRGAARLRTGRQGGPAPGRA